jgi:cardiolipin synthase
LILPTGPADERPACTLALCHLINETRRRLWIASPYFVPDLDILTALRLAVLRGVDVRVLLPGVSDNRVAWLAGIAFAREAQEAGVRMWRHRPGFMHQKALLADDWAAAIGTVNFDNRSLRLNFEITAIMFDPAFAARVEAMLRRDFDAARPDDASALMKESIVVGWLAPAARLLAPVL